MPSSSSSLHAPVPASKTRINANSNEFAERRYDRFENTNRILYRSFVDVDTVYDDLSTSRLRCRLIIWFSSLSSAFVSITNEMKYEERHGLRNSKRKIQRTKSTNLCRFHTYGGGRKCRSLIPGYEFHFAIDPCGYTTASRDAIYCNPSLL